MQELPDNAITSLTFQLHTIELSGRRELVSVANGVALRRTVFTFYLATRYLDVLRAHCGLRNRRW